MKIYLGTDHAGFKLKEAIRQYLTEGGHDVVDCGALNFNKDDSFVNFVTDAARQAAADPSSRAIIMGGSGQGEAMAVNRLKGVRAMVYYAPGNALTLDYTGAKGQVDGLDIVRLARQHNNSNVLSLGARFVSTDQAKAAIDVWLKTEFSGEVRYQDRIQAIETFLL